MNYEQYLQSVEWRSLREQVLERDGNCCQTCLSTESLEVHHKTYERLGQEDLTDLITLCHECHEAITTTIRRRRYQHREINASETERQTPTITVRVENGTPTIEVQAHIRSTPAFTQRADVRSDEQICQADEGDFFQARQDGRRF